MAADHSAQATPFATVTSCKTSGICLDVRNNGTGIAINGVARTNFGIQGQVTNVSPFTYPLAGVYGIDSATALADYNFGVWGDSSNGTGVLGQTFALGNQSGVKGVDGSPTVNSDIGVLGFSQFNFGVYAQTDSGIGLFATANDSNAVQAFNASSLHASLAMVNSASTGPLWRGYSIVRGAFKEVASLDNHGNLVLAGNLQTGGNPQFSVQTSKGTGAVAYASRTTASTLEDVGEAQLTGGQSYVRLTPTFATMIDLHTPYLVFITPQGETRGLYVTQKSAAGFAVREAGGGRSSAAFDYRIVARPFGSAAQTLATQANAPQASTLEVQSLGRGAALRTRRPVVMHH